jgi:hypothetical protein
MFFQVHPNCKNMQAQTTLQIPEDCDQVLGRERSRVPDSQLSGPWQAVCGQRVPCAFKQAVRPEHPYRSRCLHVSLCGDSTLQQNDPSGRMVEDVTHGLDPVARLDTPEYFSAHIDALLASPYTV